jgi:hypothetical protein
MRRFLLASLLFVASAQAANIEVYKSEADLRKWVEEVWYPAWVGGAPAVDKLVPLFAKDGVYIDPDTIKHPLATKGGIKGHDALRKFFTIVLTPNPDWKFVTHGVYPTKNGMVLHWVGHIPRGKDKTIVLRGTDIFQFDKDGLVAQVEEFFDRTDFLDDRPDILP